MSACDDLLSLFAAVQPARACSLPLTTQRLSTYSPQQFELFRLLFCELYSSSDMVKGKQVSLSTVLAVFWLRKVEKLTYSKIARAFQREETWARRQVQKVIIYFIEVFQM